MLRSLNLLPLALFTLSLPTFAGGPLVVGGPTFGVEGQPFVWDNSHPVQYRTDTGVLGDMSNSVAIAHVQAALAVWTGVPTANLATINAGPIQGVAGGHVASVADFNNVQGSCSTGSQTPIIFDSNGTLFSELIGDASVIGFTSLCKTQFRRSHPERALRLQRRGRALRHAAGSCDGARVRPSFRS